MIVAGVKTHACVRQLALDAWHAGLTVWVASDAIASDDPLHAVTTRRYLEARGVKFLSNAEIAAGLNDGVAMAEPDPSGLAAAAVNAFQTSDATIELVELAPTSYMA